MPGSTNTGLSSMNTSNFSGAGTAEVELLLGDTTAFVALGRARVSGIRNILSNLEQTNLINSDTKCLLIK